LKEELVKELLSLKPFAFVPDESIKRMDEPGMNTLK